MEQRFRENQMLGIKRSILFAMLVPLVGCEVLAQSTEVSTEYLMTIRVLLGAEQKIDDDLYIYPIRDGGHAKGPKIEGEVRGPGADWFRVLPSGAGQIEVRATIAANDGASIYISYTGVSTWTDEAQEKFENGEVITPDDVYFVTAVTLRTSSEKYDWLNSVQCIGKMTKLMPGQDSFVEYDIFVVR